MLESLSMILATCIIIRDHVAPSFPLAGVGWGESKRPRLTRYPILRYPARP